MTKEEIFAMMNASPVFHLATVDENGQPHVRGMLLFRADENGIIFHTGDFKDVFKQLVANPKAEICLNHKGMQIRVEGNFDLVNDDALVEEIYNHPSRKFLRDWNSLDDTKKFIRVFRMRNGKAHVWSMTDNFKPKTFIML